jgi:thiol-disulfide isomerase/thioredoxin
MDNSYRTELVKTQDARNAIEALLAHKEVAVTHTGVFGCSTKWKEKAAGREAALQKINDQPVSVQMISKAELSKLRTNPEHQLTLIDFWATWCGSCIVEFSDLQDTLRMYGGREFSLVTVSANMPDEQPSVLRLLQKKHATSKNYLFDSQDTAALQTAFDPKWDSAVPYTILLSADGKVLYKQLGSADMLELKRIILANLPSDYKGFNQYWKGN